MLPNLLIIGAGKSGTTSLHQYLDAHPEIKMSAKKELKLFVRDDWKNLVRWYWRQFEDAPVRGESSPSYTMFPYLSSTAERIHELIPDCRFIYVVRDPVERAVASYVELVSLGLETRSAEVALTDFDDPSNPHLCGSRYATQLGRFLRYFDPAQILILDHVELLRNRADTLRRTFRFLGVDPGFESAEFARTFNPRAHKVVYGRVGMWLARHKILMKREGPFERGPLIWPLNSLLSRPIDTEMSDAAVAQLVSHFKPEVEDLRKLAGQDFSNWRYFPADSRAATAQT